MYPIIELGDGVYIPTYFLFISLAYCVGLYWAVHRTDARGMDRNHTIDLGLIIMIGGFLGSRLLHVFYERPDFYFARPWDVFKFWQGGFVFYGGAIGALFPALYYCKKKNLSIPQYLDIFAPVVPLVYSIGRFATFLSGSGYGRPSDLPWAVTFPPGTEAPAGIPLHPTQIYACLWEFSVCLLIVFLERTKISNSLTAKLKDQGSLFYTMMFFHGMGRALVEQFRDDFRGDNILNLSISTWISFLVMLGAFFLVLRKRIIR